MNWDETKERACRVMASAEAVFPPEYTENARELMNVNEWKIAIECLCDNLHEAPHPLPKQLLEDLRTVAASLGISSEYWKMLKSEELAT